MSPRSLMVTKPLPSPPAFLSVSPTMMILDFSAFPCHASPHAATGCHYTSQSLANRRSLTPARRGRTTFPLLAPRLVTYPFPEGVDEDASVDTEGEADAEGPVDSNHVLVEPHRPRGPTRLCSFRRRRRDAQALPPPQAPPSPSASGGAEEGARRRAWPGRPRVRRSGAAEAAWGGGARNGEGRWGE